MQANQTKSNAFAQYIAMFALLFLSLAPTISHFIVANNGTVNFQPSICTSSQSSITIDVITTKGQRLKTTFVTEPTLDQAPQSQLLVHLEHCPFCSLSADDQGFAVLAAYFFGISPIAQTKWTAYYLTTPFSDAAVTGFQPRAPPFLS